MFKQIVLIGVMASSIFALSQVPSSSQPMHKDLVECHRDTARDPGFPICCKSAQQSNCFTESLMEEMHRLHEAESECKNLNECSKKWDVVDKPKTHSQFPLRIAGLGKVTCRYEKESRDICCEDTENSWGVVCLNDKVYIAISQVIGIIPGCGQIDSEAKEILRQMIRECK